MSDILGSFIGGAFGLAGSALNYGYQKQLAEQQNQYNLDMWKMQNEYNSPSAQMQRFKSAGLNPNLIYGQGSAGNAQSAPQMVTPRAPEVSEDMARLGQAFNLVGLNSAIAEMHEKQEKANQEAITTANMKDERDARALFGGEWTFDYKSGKWVYTPESNSDYSVTSVRKLPLSLRWKWPLIGSNNTGVYLHNLNKQSMYRFLQPIYLREAFQAPQVHMLNYEASHIPTTYWIGQGTKVANSVANFIPKFKFGRDYTAPNGRRYYY